MTKEDTDVVNEGAEAAEDKQEEEEEEQEEEQPKPTRETFHNLQKAWTMHYDAPSTEQKGGNWEDKIIKVSTFDTVEDFWSLFNNLVKPSKIPLKGNYHFFKDGVKPMWEDPENEKGGKWTVEFARKDTAELDKVWLYLLLGMIGESFADNQEICGAVVSIRKSRNRIAIWTKTANDKTAQNRLGKELKQCLELGARQGFSYVTHADANSKAHYKRVTYEL